MRINAGLQQVNENLQYSRFMKALKDANISLNRKMLAEIAVADFSAFSQIVKKAGLK
jgi:large subunit ribosomal protein L20